MNVGNNSAAQIKSVMEWRLCRDFPDYEVSEYGDVRRATKAQTRAVHTRLRGFIDHDGYIRYTLLSAVGEKRIVLAHRLVACAFLGQPPSESHEVAHNNGSTIFNHFSNLRWATRRQNHSDMQIHGTALKGVKNGRAKLTEADVHTIRSEYARIKRRESSQLISELAGKFGIHHATLIHIAKGRSWSHLQSRELSV